MQGGVQAQANALKVLAYRHETIAQGIADVVRFRHLLFRSLGVGRHREVDELGGGGGDQADAPPDEVVTRFGLLSFGHAPSLGAVGHLTHT
jgi:hypothetical protein